MEVQDTDSETESFAGQSIEVDICEIHYTPPLVEEEFIATWKVASFPQFRIIVGLETPEFDYTVTEFSFR